MRKFSKIFMALFVLLFAFCFTATACTDITPSNEEGRQGPPNTDFLEFPVGKTNYKQSFKTYLWKGAVEDILERLMNEIEKRL